MIAQYLPLVGVVLFIAVGFVWRAWLQYRRYGNPGVILFRSARPEQLRRDALFIILLLAAVAQAAVAAVSTDVLAPLYVFAPSQNTIWLVVSGLLLFGGIALMVTAQLHLGASWRIGIDEGARPGLVNGGCYQLCRNPIFLGMFVMLAGLATLQPTWISAVVVLGAAICVRSQVLEEEAYLLATYATAYRDYARRVGRFVPGLGKLC
jgi:protein-S-isoprenylcysteine O-methyltransferase Ste14